MFILVCFLRYPKQSNSGIPSPSPSISKLCAAATLTGEKCWKERARDVSVRLDRKKGMPDNIELQLLHEKATKTSSIRKKIGAMLHTMK